MTTASPEFVVERDGCRIVAVAFDFDGEDASPLDASNLAVTEPGERFLWIDVDVLNPVAALSTLVELGLPQDVVEEMFSTTPRTAQSRSADGLLLTLAACEPDGDELRVAPVNVLMNEHRLISVHRGPVSFLNAMRREYREDFARYARSPSFLLYELWDHLVEHYAVLQQRFEERVESLQRELLEAVDERAFERVAAIVTDLLRFRSTILPARSVLSELGARKSRFVSEATQSFLVSMAHRVETIAADLLTDRDVISSTLDLHMSMIAHRTNLAVKRLTGISFVFLPLTFLCGVYGMNFRHLPELGWPWGYPLFWSVALVITAAQLWILRRTRML